MINTKLIEGFLEKRGYTTPKLLELRAKTIRASIIDPSYLYSTTPISKLKELAAKRSQQAERIGSELERKIFGYGSRAKLLQKVNYPPLKQVGLSREAQR